MSIEMAIHGYMQPSQKISFYSVGDVTSHFKHSAVLSKEHGVMFVWGGTEGRQKQSDNIQDVDGVWSLNIAGETSRVLFTSFDDERQDMNMLFGVQSIASILYSIITSIFIMILMVNFVNHAMVRFVEEHGTAAFDINDVTEESFNMQTPSTNGLSQELIGKFISFKSILPIQHVSPLFESVRYASFKSLFC